MSILKVKVENLKGSVENLTPEESIEGANTVLRGSVKASEGKPKATKPRGKSLQGFAAKGLLKENPEGAFTLPRSTVYVQEALSWGTVIPDSVNPLAAIRLLCGKPGCSLGTV